MAYSLFEIIIVIFLWSYVFSIVYLILILELSTHFSIVLLKQNTFSKMEINKFQNLP